MRVVRLHMNKSMIYLWKALYGALHRISNAMGLIEMMVARQINMNVRPHLGAHILDNDLVNTHNLGH